MAANFSVRFPPYFHFRFGGKWYFWRKFAVFARSSFVDPLRTVFEVGQRPIFVLSITPRPEVVSSVERWPMCPYILSGSNRKSIAASSFLPFLSCFHFPFGRKCLTATGTTFRCRTHDSEHAKCGGVYFIDSVVSTFGCIVRIGKTSKSPYGACAHRTRTKLMSVVDLDEHYPSMTSLDHAHFRFRR